MVTDYHCYHHIYSVSIVLFHFVLSLFNSPLSFIPTYSALYVKITQSLPPYLTESELPIPLFLSSFTYYLL